MKIRIDLTVLESGIMEKKGVELMGSSTYLGYIEIDPFKGIKSKQKLHLHSVKSDTTVETNITFTVSVSDSFRIIEKLIPPNCLCGPDDIIPGLAGRKLPTNVGILSTQI